MELRSDQLQSLLIITSMYTSWYVLFYTVLKSLPRSAVCTTSVQNFTESII